MTSIPDIDRWLAASAADLMPETARLRDAGHGRLVSYSKNRRRPGRQAQSAAK